VTGTARTDRNGVTTFRDAAGRTTGSVRKNEPMAEHENSIGATSDWFTPQPIFDAIRLEFDLDPAHPGWLVAARTSADWFHDVVVPNAQLLCFPNGKTKFVRPDGSVGAEPGTGVVLIGAGAVACAALRRSGLGACMTVERASLPEARQPSLFGT
jgi:hypothetical protein